MKNIYHSTCHKTTSVSALRWSVSLLIGLLPAFAQAQSITATVFRRSIDSGIKRYRLPIVSCLAFLCGLTLVLFTFSYSAQAQTTLGGVNLGTLPNYLFVYTDARNDANWQSASDGHVGDVAIDGIQADERTSGSFAYSGTIYTNDATLGAWQAIINNNPGQASASFNQTTRLANLTTDLENVFTQVNALPVTAGFANRLSTSLNGLNTQNGIAERFVINITSGLQVSSQINITGDAGDIYILRWDTDQNFSNGYNGQVKFQSGGAIVPLGGLKATNFIHVAGEISSSGGGSTPTANNYPQGPRVNDGQGALITNGKDFGAGGFFTGYWFTTGDPTLSDSGQPYGPQTSLSNGIFVGGWYSKNTQFSMTSGTSGVYVSPPAICTLTITANPGACNPTSNKYTVSGTVTLTNNSSGGTATITDGAKSTTVTVGTSATSIAYSLTGMTSDVTSHTVTVNLPSCGSAMATYTAPASCTGQTSCDPLGLGAASQFGILGLQGGTVIINSGTRLEGNVGYSAGITSNTNQKVETFIGTVYVSSQVTSFNYTPATFAPSGGIIGFPTPSATADALLNQANTDAIAASSTYAALPVNVNLGTLGDNDNRTVNSVGPLTVVQVNSLNYNSDNITLVGRPGLDDMFVINVLGSFDFSQSTVTLTNVRPERVLWNFPNANTHILLNKSATVFQGTILAPTSLAEYHNPATFNGAIIARDVNVHSAFNLTYGASVCICPANLTLMVNRPLNCTATTATLTASNSTTGVTYAFSGPGITASGSNTAVVNRPGTYTVIATGPGGCTAVATTTVTVVPNPTATLNSVSICASQTATLTTSFTGATSFTLTGGGITPIVNTSGIFTVNPANTTTYTVIVSNGSGCSATATGTVTVIPLPSLTLTASPSATVTAGNSVTLTVSGCTGGTTTWSTGGADTGKANVVVMPVQGSNTYSVICTTPTGCTGTASIVITGLEPSSLVVTSVTVCAGQPATLLAMGCGSGTVNWSARVGTPGTSPSAGTLVTVSTMTLIGITSATVLSYTATCMTGAGSMAVSTVTVIPLPSLTLTASPSATVTAGNSVTLTASGCTGGTTTWSTGGADTGKANIVVMASLGSTVYSATCTTPSGCTGTASIMVVGTAPLTAGLGDKVFEDLNADGIQQTNEPGVPNVTVTLFGNGTTVTTTTNSNGIYSFTGLTPGVSYTVGFSVPAGYSATLQNIGSDDTNSDGNPVTGITRAYSLSANEFNPTIDMGYYKPASLGDKVFTDVNKNGIQDAGTDTPISGVTVILYINGVASATTTTASSGTGVGCYSFTGLTPGSSVSYSVGFGTPNGYTATTPKAPGSTPATDSDVSPVSGRTGSITLASGEYNSTLDAGYVLLPVASLIVSSATVCAGATASLSASGCVGMVMWSAGTSPSMGTLVTVSTAALMGISSQTVLSYTATCTVGSSVTTAVSTVTVNPLPSLTLTASPSATVTAGNSVTLTASGCTGGTTTWSTGGADTGKARIVVMPVQGSNTYSVICTTPTGCTGTASVVITGLEPSSLVVTSATVCAGQSATLLAMGCGSGTVNWSARVGTPGTNPSAGTLVTVSTAALSDITSQTVLSYTVTCTNGTTTTAISTVTVNPLPSLTITASPGEIVTAGNSVTLTATGCMNGSVNWSTGQGSVMSVVVPAGSVAGSTVYSATCVTPSGCTDTRSIEIMTVAAACNLAVTAVPGDCVPATNQYVLTGSVSATGSMGVTSVTVSSGGKSVVVSMNGNGPASYTLSGLVSDNSAHAVSAVSSASTCAMASVTYAAPQSCSVAPPVRPMFDITKVVNTTRAKLGDVLSYTVTLVNTSTASGSVVATDVLDSNLLYVPNSASVSAGTYNSTAGIWTVASLPGSASATLTFSASVLAEGIVYNTASIDSKTVSVCTSIPVRVCAGSEYAFSLSVASGMTRYQWYKDDVLIQDNGATATGPAAYTGTSPNALLVTTKGAYRVVVNEGVNGQCPDLSCCPFVVEEVSLPTGLSLTAAAPTCIGTMPQPNGKVVVTGLGSSTANVGLTYQYVTGGMSFTSTPTQPQPVPAAVLPANGEIVTNAVGGITYFVRVYGPALADGSRCSVDLTVVVPVANCACPAEVCVPVSIKKTKTRTR